MTEQGVSAGGRTGSQTWRHNPAFVLRAPRGAEVRLTLIQPDARRAARRSGTAITYEPVGITVVAPAAASVLSPATLIPGPHRVAVAQTTYWNSRGVSTLIQSTGVPLVVVPACWSPGVESRFKLLARSSAGALVLEPLATVVERWHSVTVTGEWNADAGTAGGQPCEPTFPANPQYRLKLGRAPELAAAAAAGRVPVHAVLQSATAPSANKRDHSVAVHFVAGVPGRLARAVTKDSVVGSAKFTDSETSVRAVLLAPGTEVLVIPSKFRARKEAKFSLTVHSLAALELAPAQPSGSAPPQPGANGRRRAAGAATSGPPVRRGRRGAPSGRSTRSTGATALQPAGVSMERAHNTVLGMASMLAGIESDL